MSNDIKFNKTGMICYIIITAIWTLIVCGVIILDAIMRSNLGEGLSRVDIITYVLPYIILIFRTIKEVKFCTKSKVTYDEKNISGAVVGLGRKRNVRINLPMEQIGTVTPDGKSITITSVSGQKYVLPSIKNAKFHAEQIRKFAHDAKSTSQTYSTFSKWN